LAIRRALESAGVEFIEENGGGPAYAFEGLQSRSGEAGDFFAKRTQFLLTKEAAL
jgi:hypothetical protein